MIFQETRLSGAFLVKPERQADDRGFFARTWCEEEFGARKLVSRFAQGGLSFNPVRGTLRGLHLQRPPCAEVKLVRCVRGAIFDVIVDLRPESPTFRQWIGIELTANSYLMLYIPELFAHGFQTLEPDTEIDYLISVAHEPTAATGVRYDDPALAIDWPLTVTRISQKDRGWPLLDAAGGTPPTAPWRRSADAEPARGA